MNEVINGMLVERSGHNGGGQFIRWMRERSQPLARLMREWIDVNEQK